MSPSGMQSRKVITITITFTVEAITIRLPWLPRMNEIDYAYVSFKIYEWLQIITVPDYKCSRVGSKVLMLKLTRCAGKEGAGKR